MRTTPYARVIKGADIETFQPMKFSEFSERPVNYHKDILLDMPINGTRPPENQDITKRVEAALEERIEKIKKAQESVLAQKYEEGIAAGKASASNELNRAIELLQQSTKLLEAEKGELASRYEKEIVKIGFELAARILGNELKDRPQAVYDVVRGAVNQVLDCGKITVRANPDDIQYLKTLQADLEDALSKETKFELRPDASVTRGGCMIDSEKGTLDARIESQLDTLKAHFGHTES